MYYQGKTMPLSRFSLLLVLLVLGEVNCNAGFLTARPETTDGKTIVGYENLVIAVSEAVPVDSSLLEGIKKLFLEASNQLYNSTKQKAYFKNITILLPPSWKTIDNVDFKEPTLYETFSEAEVQVLTQPEKKGNYVKTIRSGGCGENGLAIQLSSNFLKSAVSDEKQIKENAKVLIKEWAIYRYGVFDECGYDYDLVSPGFYYHKDKSAPTGCTNQELRGKPTGNCGDHIEWGVPGPDCDFILEDKQPLLTSSLMYKPEWSEISHFCDEHTHNKDAPTKHNILCQEKSVWEVINNNEDFQNVNSNPTFNPVTNFKLVSTSHADYVVIFDVSQHMASKLDPIKHALKRAFTKEFRNENAVGVLWLSNEIEEKRNLDSYGDGAKLFTALPEGPVAVTSNVTNPNIVNAISKGFEMLNNSPNKQRRSIILFTAGNVLVEDTSDVCQLMEKDRIRLIIVLTSFETEQLNKDTSEKLLKLVTCSKGAIYTVHKVKHETHAYSVEQLKSVFRAIFVENESAHKAVQIHYKYFEPEDTVLNGSFTVDNTVGRNTIFRLTQIGNPFDKLSITDPDGKVYDSDNSAGLSYVSQDKNDEIGFDIPGAKPGLWSYKFKMPIPGTLEAKAAISVLSEPAKDDTITVRCWTNVDHKLVEGETTPVILYTEVKKGTDAVRGARVVATLLPEIDAKNIHNSHSVQLFDDGNGDPDVAMDDGIYSHYFVNLTTKGFYSFTVNVTGIENITQIIQETFTSTDESKGRIAACKSPVISSKYTGSFERYAVGSSIYVSKPLEGSNLMPPNRIADLKVRVVNTKNNFVTLQWTAAGDMYDEGTAASYEVYYSKDRTTITEDRLRSVTWTSLNDKLKKILPNHHELEATIDIPVGDHYYFVIRAINKANKPGKPSNIVSAYKQREFPVTTVSPDFNGTDSTNGTKGGSDGDSETAKIGPIIGIVFAAILLIAIVVVIWWVTKNRRKKRQEANRHSASYSKVSQSAAEEGGAKQSAN